MNCSEVAEQKQQGIVDKQMLRIGQFVLTTMGLLVFVTLSRFSRGWGMGSAEIKYVASTSTAIIALLVSYIFGLIHDANVKHELVPIWAVLMVFMYANISWDSLKLKDGSTTGVVIVKFFMYIVYAIIMLVGTHPSSYIPLSILLLGSCCKVAESVSVQIFVSNADDRIIRSNRKADDDDDDDDDEEEEEKEEEEKEDPFVRCKYVVYPGYPKFEAEDASKVVTVQDIWACAEQKGSLFSSSNDPLQTNKNNCLSVALFWKLLNKIVGIPTYEGTHQNKAWKLIRHGLLRENAGPRCPFEVVKVELSVLHNFLYHNTGFFLYRFGLRLLILNQLMFFVPMTWIGRKITNKLKSQHVLFSHFKMKIHFSNDNQVANYQIYAFATTIMMLYLMVAELLQFVYGFGSMWPKMSFILKYLKRESWKSQKTYDCSITKAIVFANIHQKVLAQLAKVFRKSGNQTILAQYSLLESFSTKQHFLWKTISRMAHTFFGKRIARPGREQGNGTALTAAIKEVVRESMRIHGRQLSNGIASLEAIQLPHGVTSKLTQTCTQLDAKVVLVWHIATSICGIKSKQTRKSTNFQVATTLSKYCAYLVAFAPNLLPGNAAITDYTCSLAIKNACARLKDCKSLESICSKLVEMADEHKGEIEASKRNKDTILQQGADLGRILEDRITEPKRWKILATFWAEMILYLAPSDNNEWAHVEKLATGGEFITQLWALLFHAGIVNRNSLRNGSKVASTRSS